MIRKILIRCNEFWQYRMRNRLNITKTLMLNLMLMPLKTALKFPILVYGPCCIGRATGEVRFLAPVKKGMLKIGISDPVRSRHSKSYVHIAGTIAIADCNELRRGMGMQVMPGATLTLGGRVVVGDNCTIICFESISIGYATRVGNNTTFMDTDIHYVYNAATASVQRNQRPIDIGENCWIGGNCLVKKGTVLPKGTILAGPFSMTSKDYASKIAEYTIIAGSPAKPIAEGHRRVNNDVSEAFLRRHFASTGQPYVHTGDVDDFCLPR